MPHSVTHLGLLDDEAIILDTAALEIALADNEGTEIGSYTDLLAQMAERIAVLGSSAETSAARAAVLAQVIAHEFSFEGDRVNYDDPRNADLIQVLERRRGLPVSLTILYVAAARRIGWEAHALNTPGHVLARLGGETDPVLFDPFNRGAIVGAEDLAALLRNVLGGGAIPSSEHVTPMTNRAVLVRLLINQATRAESGGDLKRTLTLYRRITTIAPDHAQGWWERARLSVALGDTADGRSSLSAMLEVTREPNIRAHIFAAMEALARL